MSWKTGKSSSEATLRIITEIEQTTKENIIKNYESIIQVILISFHCVLMHSFSYECIFRSVKDFN